MPTSAALAGAAAGALYGGGLVLCTRAIALSTSKRYGLHAV